MWMASVVACWNYVEVESCLSGVSLLLEKKRNKIQKKYSLTKKKKKKKKMVKISGHITKTQWGK